MRSSSSELYLSNGCNADRIAKSPDFRRSFAVGRFEIRRTRTGNNAPPPFQGCVSHLPPRTKRRGTAKLHARVYGIYNRVRHATKTGKIYSLPPVVVINDLGLLISTMRDADKIKKVL